MCCICPYSVYSQKTPSLELNFGFSFPGKDLAGDFVSVSDSGFYSISPEFVRDNYGTSTGVNASGSITFPLDDKRLLNFIFTGEYNYFNAFRKSILGVGKENNVTVPVTYDNSFSSTTVGLGIGTNPGVFKNVSAYLNSAVTMNFLSMSYTKNDIFRTYFSDSFRMGIKTGAGLSYQINQEYSFILGASYNISNLLFKSVHSGYSDRLESNRDNLPVNDAAGSFYTNLSDPSAGFSVADGKKKNIDWWSINAGISILLGKSKK